MTSKEKLASIVSALEITGEANIKKDIVKQYKEDIFKDLEDYEELKKIMGTPIQDIMKRLKILEILKPMLKVEKGGTWWYLDTKRCFFENEEQIKKIKEWLDEKNI